QKHMLTLITCPSCKHEFAPEDAIAKSLENKYQEKFDSDRQKLLKQYAEQANELEEKNRLFEKKKEKENELFAERMEKEKQRLENDIQERLRKSISTDYENQLKLLKESVSDNEEKLKLARQKELTFLQKEQQLKTREEELEISVQKKLAAERLLLAEQIRKQEKEKNEIKETETTLKMRELEKQIEDQKKLEDE